MKPPQQDRNGRELWPAARRVPSLMALAGLVALGLLQSAPPPAHAGPLLGPPLVEPFALHSQNGVLDTTLVEKPGVAQVAGIPVQNVWTYQLGEDGAPNYPGPTLYVQPGDTLRLRIVNRLPPSLPPAAIDLVPVPTVTNLHTHGLHVSPLGNSDNVLITIPPDATNQYE